MPFAFPPVALVTRSTTALLATLRNKNRILLSDEANVGIVGVELKANRALSIALEPHRWQIDSAGLIRPVGDNPPTIVYEMPSQLRGVEAIVCLMERERGKRGGSVTAVGDYNGAPCRPFRIDGKAHTTKRGDWHERVIFTGMSLSRVMWAFPRKGPRGRLSVSRAQLTQEGNHFVVRCERVVSFLVGRIEDAAPRLRGDLEKWQPAVGALMERLRCDGCGDAHYRLR